MKIDQPDFVYHIQLFLHTQEHLDFDLLASQAPTDLPQFNKKITVYPSAVAMFFSPSDISGIRGMHCEHISVQLIHGEKAHLGMIASLWRLTSILQEYLVLTLLMSSYSFLSHITMSSTFMHLCIGCHACLNQWIAALACGCRTRGDK